MKSTAIWSTAATATCRSPRSIPRSRHAPSPSTPEQDIQPGGAEDLAGRHTEPSAQGEVMAARRRHGPDGEHLGYTAMLRPTGMASPGWTSSCATSKTTATSSWTTSAPGSRASRWGSRGHLSRVAGLPARGHTEQRPLHVLPRVRRVAFNDGATFGRGGEGFVRLNFGARAPSSCRDSSE